MICAIYKSPKKQETYLYLAKRDDFSRIPAELLITFGTPSFVMLINLENRSKLAIANIKSVKQQILEKGFYLQLPPPTENLLTEHKKQQGINE